MSKLIEIGKKRNIYSVDKKIELEKLLEQGYDYLLIAQELCDLFGRASFLDELVKIFKNKEVSPTAIHRELHKIPFSFVVTTNYDQLIENAYAKNIGIIPKTCTHEDAEDFSDALWGDDFFILKAHGDIARKNTIVLTKKDYRDIIFSAPGYKAVMSAIFITKSILFLGVSLTDPETELLLSYLHDAFHGSGQYHYALIPENECTKTIANRWRKDYKVDCIPYKATDGHPEVHQFIKELSKRLGE